MGISLLLVAEYSMMIQMVDAYAACTVNEETAIQDHSNVDDLAFFVIKKGQITFFHFVHEVDGGSQFRLLLAVPGYILTPHPAKHLHQSGPVEAKSRSSTRNSWKGNDSFAELARVEAGSRDDEALSADKLKFVPIPGQCISGLCVPNRSRRYDPLLSLGQVQDSGEWQCE